MIDYSSWSVKYIKDYYRTICVFKFIILKLYALDSNYLNKYLMYKINLLKWATNCEPIRHGFELS